MATMVKMAEPQEQLPPELKQEVSRSRLVSSEKSSYWPLQSVTSVTHHHNYEPKTEASQFFYNRRTQLKSPMYRTIYMGASLGKKLHILSGFSTDLLYFLQIISFHRYDLSWCCREAIFVQSSWILRLNQELMSSSASLRTAGNSRKSWEQRITRSATSPSLATKNKKHHPWSTWWAAPG